MTPDLPGYRLDRRLGRGGAAEVWLAWPGSDGAGPVAIKRVPAADLGSPARRAAAVERLRAEGRILADLDHPNLVAVLEVVEEPCGPALVLPYLAGGTLRDLLDDRGTLDAGELLAVLEPVAGALLALLDRGHVHGDVKPENVLFTGEGAPVLVDAGSVRPLGDRTTQPTVEGTPDYLDPSRLDGRPSTGATDVFSLGVLAYEVLTGRRPHRGDPSEVLASAAVGAHRPLASWPTVDGDVAEVVERAMAPDPSDRPADPAALVTELRRAVPGARVRLPGPARTGSLPSRPGRRDTVRVRRPERDPSPTELGVASRRVGAVRAAVAVISVALAAWAGPARDDAGPDRRPPSPAARDDDEPFVPDPTDAARGGASAGPRGGGSPGRR